MLLGHNVLIYCSQLISVGRRNEALHKKLSVEVLHLILCEEKPQSQAKRRAFFQFLVHNVLINSSELLRVRKRNEALVHSFT